jgi:hypothetical protein
MNCNTLKKQITRRILLLASATVLAVGFMVSLPLTAHAQKITPPTVPTNTIEVEAGNEPFLLGRGVGTQNYVCSPCDPTTPNCPLGFAFTLFTPQATLFDDQGEQLMTHFSSPNPVEKGIIRVTWQDSRDTSSVWAKLVKQVNVDPNSINWVLLNVKDTGTQAGPNGGDRLTKTTFIQRVNTVGGLAPPERCQSSLDLGHQEFVHYTADYFFYKKSKIGN